MIRKGSHQNTKCPKMWKNSLTFLTPPPPLGWFGLFWILEKIDIWLPPSRTEFGKNLKCRQIWECRIPSDPCKTVPKSYLTDTSGLFQSYISHVCSKCCLYLMNITPIWHQNQGHFSVIWIWEKPEYPDPPPLISK